MNFISVKFVLFFTALLLLYRFIKKEKCKQLLLLAASYVFYAAASVKFMLLLALMSLLTWAIGIWIQRYKEKEKTGKRPLVIGIVICLSVLGYFKYCGFFVESFTELFGLQQLDTLNIILPLGISFYTFQAISYICDVYLGKIQPVSEPWKVMLYIGFFPQIVSGPIVKARDFVPQLYTEHKITKENLSYGVQLIITGLFKKVVVADRLGVGVDAVYAAPAVYSGTSLLVAAIGYAIQIYCDFSGYSDMALGVARILGYNLGVNFNIPYISKNPSDFWRRWHISLSSWFKEYVYIPLGGNRKGKARTHCNLFITMLLSGLWHGANWTFVAWGACHGLTSTVNKIYRDIREKNTRDRTSGKENKVAEVISIIINVAIAWLLWIPFRADNFSDAMTVIKGIFTNQQGISYIYEWTIVYTLLIMGIQIYRKIVWKGDGVWKPLDLNKFRNQVLFCTFALLIVVFAYVGDTAFIYANF